MVPELPLQCKSRGILFHCKTCLLQPEIKLNLWVLKQILFFPSNRCLKIAKSGSRIDVTNWYQNTESWVVISTLNTSSKARGVGTQHNTHSAKDRSTISTFRDSPPRVCKQGGCSLPQSHYTNGSLCSVVPPGRSFSFSGGSTILRQWSANSKKSGSCMYFFMKALLSSVWSTVTSSCLRCGLSSILFSSSECPGSERMWLQLGVHQRRLERKAREDPGVHARPFFEGGSHAWRPNPSALHAIID